MKSKILILFVIILSFISLGKINAQEYGELVKYDRERNMLVFRDEESVSRLYDVLQEQLEKRAQESDRETEEDDIEDNPVLRDFGKAVGFYEKSLRYSFLASEYEQLENGIDPSDIVRPRVRNRIFQTLLNEDYALQIGEEIILLLPFNRVVLKEYDLDKIKRIVRSQLSITKEVVEEDLLPISDEGGDITVFPGDGCSPDFTFSDFSSSNEVRFTFTGTPSDPVTVSYSWDFGDGSPLSTEANPSHKYGIAKNYKVCLTITQKKDGIVTCTNKICKTLTTQTECTSTFSFSGFTTDLTGQFTYTGKKVTDMKFSWDFGDGTPLSTEENPKHTYATKGVKQVCLTVESPNCNKPSTTCKTVLGGAIDTDCIAAFTSNTTGVGCLTCFTPAPTGILSSDPITAYEWSFGDGETSKESNPCHKYTCNGNKSVSLKLTTKSGKTCTSLQSLVGINVNNCGCCQRNVFEEKEFEYDNNLKKILYELDSDQYWIGAKNVNAEMHYFERKSVNDKWSKKAKAKLQINLWGSVLGEASDGCKCKTDIPVTTTGGLKLTHRQYTEHSIGNYFGQNKNGGVWGADFWVDGVLVLKKSISHLITCE
jgi:PKD repeat protein